MIVSFVYRYELLAGLSDKVQIESLTVSFSWALLKNSVMEMMKIDSYVTQSHNIKMFAYMCGNVWILLPPYHFKTLPSTHKAIVKWLVYKYTVIYIQMYINDSPEDHTFTRLEDLHMPQMVFYCNILLFVLMSYSHGLFKTGFWKCLFYTWDIHYQSKVWGQ